MTFLGLYYYNVTIQSDRLHIFFFTLKFGMILTHKNISRSVTALTQKYTDFAYNIYNI